MPFLHCTGLKKVHSIYISYDLGTASFHVFNITDGLSYATRDQSWGGYLVGYLTMLREPRR